MLDLMTPWFVIEEAYEDGVPSQVCTWRPTREAALEDAVSLAEAHHDLVYMLVAVPEGKDPLECITPDVLCVWHPGRIYDSGRTLGGTLQVETVSERQAHLPAPSAPAITAV
jgi:hypothetical protein